MFLASAGELVLILKCYVYMYLSTQVLRSTLRLLNIAQQILALKERSLLSDKSFKQLHFNKEQNDLCDSMLLLEYDIVVYTTH